MDPATLIGVVLTLVAVIGSMVMEGGNPAGILLPPAIILVFLGTFGAAMASGLMADAKSVPRYFKRALMSPAPVQGDIVETVVGLAEKARREGLLALEDATRNVEDTFLREGLQLAVDGTDPEELRDILESKILAKRAEDQVIAKFFTDMGGFAPTIGIIGTVLGLVHVLENLSSPEKLGHLIAGAFVATLWGVLTANAMWLPMGNKVKRVSGVEVRHMELVLEGILAIQGGANPRLVKMKLSALLPGGGETAPAEVAA